MGYTLPWTSFVHCGRPIQPQVLRHSGATIIEKRMCSIARIAISKMVVSSCFVYYYPSSKLPTGDACMCIVFGLHG